jgi:hypothetical protein
MFLFMRTVNVEHPNPYLLQVLGKALKITFTFNPTSSKSPHWPDPTGRNLRCIKVGWTGPSRFKGPCQRSRTFTSLELAGS